MFTLPVGDFLISNEGDSREFSFEGPIFDGHYPSIRFLKPLSFHIKMTLLSEGVHILFSHLHTKVTYNQKNYLIELPPFEGIWKKDPSENTEYPIDMTNLSIDLGHILEQHIIQACEAQTK